MSLPPDANRIRRAHLPTPFSATDIRAGCPLGRTIQLQSEAPGGELAFRQIRFVEVDTDGAVQEFQSTDASGLPIGEPTRHRSSWLDLQQHASQPASATVIDEIDLALPFGSLWVPLTNTSDARGVPTTRSPDVSVIQSMGHLEPLSAASTIAAR